jgi:hypothetical protein
MSVLCDTGGRAPEEKCSMRLLFVVTFLAPVWANSKSSKPVRCGMVCLLCTAGHLPSAVEQV